MNTLLSVANGVYSYYRAKKNGLWGVVGIALALLCAYNWKVIEPFFNHIGLVSLLNKLGLIVPNEPGLTGFKILYTLASISFLVMVVGMTLIAIACLLALFFSNDIGFAMIIVGLSIFLFPLAFLYGIFIYPIRHMFKKKKEALPKNEEVITNLVNASDHYAPVDNSHIPNVLSVEDGLKSLNRLPIYSEQAFLLAVSKSMDIYIVLPRPLGLDTEMYPKNTFSAYKMNIRMVTEKEKEKERQRRQVGMNGVEGPLFYIIMNKDFLKLTTLSKDDIEMIINPFRSYDIKQILKKLGMSVEYRDYVQNIHDDYFKVVKKLKRQIELGNSNEFVESSKALSEIQVGNEEVVSLLSL